MADLAGSLVLQLVTEQQPSGTQPFITAQRSVEVNINISALKCSPARRQHEQPSRLQLYSKEEQSWAKTFLTVSKLKLHNGA